MRFRRTRDRTVLKNIEKHDYGDGHEGCEDVSFLENQCDEVPQAGLQVISH